MGTIYRIVCSTCDENAKANVTFEGFSEAVLLSSDRGGRVVAGGYLVYVSPEGHLVELPHPPESYSLEAAGGTWSRATWEGRLLAFGNLLCADCGESNTTARLHTSGAGCGWGLLLGAIVIGADLFVLDLNPAVEILLVWLATFSPPFLVDGFLQWRHGKNAAPYRCQRCTQCGSARLLPFGRALKAPLPCPRCRQKTLTVEIAGKS